jgi:hypothetical protein
MIFNKKEILILELVSKVVAGVASVVTLTYLINVLKKCKK